MEILELFLKRSQIEVFKGKIELNKKKSTNNTLTKGHGNTKIKIIYNRVGWGN